MSISKLRDLRGLLLLRVFRGLAVCVLCGLPLVALRGARQPSSALTPGTRVLVDAHNAYPDGNRFADRLDRALSTGLPIAIEQDLVWYRDPTTGVARSIVSHGAPFTGQEPSLDSYFFQRIRPLIEDAFRENRQETWPVITLNLDFKTNEPEHHAALWALLGRYEPWLTTARRGRENEVDDLQIGPLLVLTGEADEQEESFHHRVPVGAKLRLFGAVHSRFAQADVSPQPRTNYRRWWNHPWSVVEQGGQANAGEWTSSDQKRLQSLVDTAHRAGLWIRFYTLNGHDPADTSGGWTASYNFGSRSAAEERWRAAARAGVDFVAVDQYDDVARVLREVRHLISRDDPVSVEVESVVQLSGTLTRADYERLFEGEFVVPSGTERIDIELRYDEANRTVIDLGLRGPAGFRGWRGGGQQRVFVATHSASYGLTPGPVEGGRWAVVLGVPNIREASRVQYTVTVRTSRLARGWPVVRADAGWYAGDLHAHSGHSDGRTMRPSGQRIPVPPEHVFNAASAAGLDFIALSDHNTASHWADVDRLQPLYPGMLLLHAREVTTYRGHLNAFGEKRFVDFRLSNERPMSALAAELARSAAVISINHPERPDDETCMGCGWNDRDDTTVRAMHAIEIVNGDLAEGPMAGWPFWSAMLNRGHRLTAIGGSDEHTPDERADQRLGQPTTVIYARELSESALLEGIRAGRVYIRTRGAEGPTLELWGEAGGRRLELGAFTSPGRLVLHAVVGRARDQVATWIRNGQVLATDTVSADGRIRQDVVARAGDWFSLILRDSAGPTLFSNAIYTSR